MFSKSNAHQLPLLDFKKLGVWGNGLLWLVEQVQREPADHRSSCWLGTAALHDPSMPVMRSPRPDKGGRLLRRSSCCAEIHPGAAPDAILANNADDRGWSVKKACRERSEAIEGASSTYGIAAHDRIRDVLKLRCLLLDSRRGGAPALCDDRC